MPARKPRGLRKASKTSPVKKRGRGRPSGYSEKIADRICLALVESNDSLHQVLVSVEDFPCYSTVWNWGSSHPEFLDKLARAREGQAERQLGQAYAELDRVLDLPEGGGKTLEDLDPRWAGVRTRHARDRAEIALKMAAIRAPRQYGKKVEVEHAVSESLSKQLDDMSKRVGEDL